MLVVQWDFFLLNIDFRTYFGIIFFLQFFNIVTKGKADHIMEGMVSSCIIWWRTKNDLAAQEELCGSHNSSYAAGFFSVRHHIMQFKTIPFYLGLLYKHCQTSDMLNSVLYNTAKPKWMWMVLPIIKYIFLHNVWKFQVLKDIKITPVVQRF